MAGPSQSGKTTWIKKLLSIPSSITPRPEKILFHYSEWQPMYNEMAKSNNKIRFVKGMFSLDQIDGKVPTLIILDDLMIEASGSKEVVSLFTRGTHHKNASVILICQNVFAKGLRTISLNSHYLVLFSSPRDQSQVAALGRQLFPRKSTFLVDAYNDASNSSAHKYLFLDLKQNTKQELRVKSNVFGESGYPPIVYVA
jgi:hypothetical protein